jgi:hypothetical protein
LHHSPLFTDLTSLHDSCSYAPWLVFLCTMARVLMHHGSCSYAPWLVFLCAGADGSKRRRSKYNNRVPHDARQRSPEWTSPTKVTRSSMAPVASLTSRSEFVNALLGQSQAAAELEGDRTWQSQSLLTSGLPRGQPMASRYSTTTSRTSSGSSRDSMEWSMLSEPPCFLRESATAATV